MTVKTIENKVAELEHRIRTVEFGVTRSRRVVRNPDPVWAQTYGIISKTKARAMLKYIAEQRKNSNRG